MTPETAGRVGDWIENELDRVRPEKFVLTFFGGEPLLYLPVMYSLSERLWHATAARHVAMSISVITNGLLLTPDVVDQLLPYGLRGVKITLDGDRDTHNRSVALRAARGRSTGSSTTSGRWPAAATSPSAETSTSSVDSYSGCSSSCARRSSPTSWSRSTSSP
jgi:sulfatase maturation enzyme AslB (radical SAM superfamily)